MHPETRQHTHTNYFICVKEKHPPSSRMRICVHLATDLHIRMATHMSRGIRLQGRENWKERKKKKDSWRPPRDVVTSSLSGAFPIAETRTNGIFVSTLCVSLFSGEMSPSLFQDFWWGNEYSIWHHQISLAYIYKFRLRTANNCLRHRWNVALNWLWKKNKMQKGQ